MEIYNNIFCVSKPDLTSGDPLSDSIKARPVMSDEAYASYCRRFPYIRVRKGGGVGCPALLNYKMLRSDIKQRLLEKYGDLTQCALRNRLQELIEPDLKASKFFREFLFDDETSLSEQKVDRTAEYIHNATILNAVGHFVSEKQGTNKRLGGKISGIWNAVSDALNTLDRTIYPHTLPSNPLRLKEKYKNYIQHGYLHLIHKGNKNINATKINDAVERLIISLFCQANLPFGAWVHDDYLKFIAGTLQIVDATEGSGVMYDREDFFDHERGTYITISRSSVMNIINNPENAIIIDRLRNNRIDHITQHTPHNHRKSPRYSLSKITMDDRDLPRKTTEGKRIHAYMAFDVMSDVILSCVWDVNTPDVATVWECFRELYRTINLNNLMWPAEVEVENHLMSGIRGELDQMFDYVTFCEPRNAKEKRAEHKIKAKKIGDEKRHQVGISRWYGKGNYKGKNENKDIEYKEPRLPLDQIIAEDKESISRFNNALHPNQKTFPGKSRWQVLVENMNPDLSRPQKHKLFRYLGVRTETSIQKNDFAQVMYENYAIDSQGSIARLKPHNYSVEAYYVPDHNGNIGEVYLYQGDTFITKATKIERYNESKVERTEDDERIRTNQAKRKAHFFKTEKDGVAKKVTRKLELLQPEDYAEILVEIVESEPVEQEITNDELTDPTNRTYTSDWAKNKAFNDI